jgi:tetratricopeptide (TPR) repeat protein
VVLLSVVGDYETLVGNYAVRGGDPARVQVAAERRAWLGKATPTVHLALAQRAIERGDVRRAQLEIERAQAIYPTADGWILRASLHEFAREWTLAARSLDEALALDPTRMAALLASARALQELGDSDGALARLEQAHARDPGNRIVRLSLDRLRERIAAAHREPAPDVARP